MANYSCALNSYDVEQGRAVGEDARGCGRCANHLLEVELGCVSEVCSRDEQGVVDHDHNDILAEQEDLKWCKLLVLLHTDGHKGATQSNGEPEGEGKD